MDSLTFSTKKLKFKESSKPSNQDNASPSHKSKSKDKSSSSSTKKRDKDRNGRDSVSKGSRKDKDKEKERKKKDKKKDKEKHKKSKSKSKDKDKGKKRKRTGSSSDSDSDSDVGSDFDWNDQSLWVEKDSNSSSNQPQTTTQPSQPDTGFNLDSDAITAQPNQSNQSQRDSWMLGSKEGASDGFDFGMFAGGDQHARKKQKRDEDEKKIGTEWRGEGEFALKISSREANPYFRDGGLGLPDAQSQSETNIQPKVAAPSWKMKKLERVFEIAEEEGRDVEEVGAERFGSLEEFKAVLAERDASLQSKPEEDSTSTDEQRVPSSTSTFLSLKNRLASSHTTFAKPVSEQPPVESSSQSIDVHHPQSSSSSKPTIAPATIPAASISSSIAKTSKPVMTQTQLNQLQAKVLKAKLMNAPNAEQLEQQYELEKSRFESSGETTEDVVVLPSIDMHGKVILSSILPSSTSQSSQPKKEEDLTIEEMVKLEKLQNLKMGSGNVSLGGARGSGTGDDEFARKVMGDKRFQSDLDYLDDHADQLSGAVDSGKKSKAEKRGKTFEIKQKERDIKDYLKQQEAIAKCPYCWKDASTSGSSSGSATTSTTKIPPSVPVISIGNKVYLALDPTNSVTECLIIPVQHMTSTLDGDDEVWDEIRNFMKCLLKKYDSENKSVIFMETILNLKWQKHTVIEVIPVPYEVKEDAPAYFREALLDSDSHWTQHQPIIDTQTKGFRRSMVPNLPYFHVWFDLDGGYGHVVEENEKWKEWFGKEIIAGVLDLGPDKYRRCRRLDKHVNHERVREFVKGWKKWDWTVMLDGGGY